MTNLWYNNIHVILDKPFEFIPNNELDETRKVNAFFRLGLYLSLLIILCGLNQKYLSIPILLILISLFLGKTEKFSNESNEKSKCYLPTKSNPFMNFTLEDYYKNPDRPKNCPVNEVRDEMIKKFRSKRIVPDPNDLFGQYISDRNFYTMPSTRIVNDQTEFAKWCFDDMGQCKSFGKNCLKNLNHKNGTGLIDSNI